MKRKNFLALSAATCSIIGAGTILFNVATQNVMAAGFGKVEKIPTSYQAPTDLADILPEPETKNEGREKVNYHLSMDSLNTDNPTETDLTMEEAAKVGEKYLQDIFGLDLEGTYVYMSYSPGTETFQRPFWSGDVLLEKEQKPESTRWTYMVDAVTGELFNIGYGRNLDVDVSLEYDAALEKDYDVYAKLARKNVKRWGLIDGPVDRVDYNCQGYSGNDPDITVNVFGKNGKRVIMTFSRYDQAFLGLITDTSWKISEASMEDVVGEVENVAFETMETVVSD